MLKYFLAFVSLLFLGYYANNYRIECEMIESGKKRRFEILESNCKGSGHESSLKIKAGSYIHKVILSKSNCENYKVGYGIELYYSSNYNHVLLPNSNLTLRYIYLTSFIFIMLIVPWNRLFKTNIYE